MKIGVLGGSFDPIHYGHLMLAEAALSEAGLDKLILVPARVQPFKQSAQPVSGELRLRMATLAAEEHPAFEVSDIELRREGISYTADTLRELKTLHPEAEKLYFISGADTFRKIEIWTKADELLSEYAFIVGTRPGYDTAPLREEIERIKEKYGTEIIVIHNPMIDISSTELRLLLSKGEDASEYIPPKVLSLIEERGLYKSGTSAPGVPGSASGIKGYEPSDEEAVIAFNHAHLNEKRLRHIEGVRQTASAMARAYSADERKASFAALAHDMYKFAKGEELNALIDEYGIDEKYKDKPNLAHSKLAAAALRRDYGIEDEDILNAVAYHTTGRPGMSKLEKILFCADALEPGRSYPDIVRLRSLMYEGLDRITLLVLEGVVDYLNREKADIDSDTLDAISYMKNEEK